MREQITIPYEWEEDGKEVKENFTFNSSPNVKESLAIESLKFSLAGGPENYFALENPINLFLKKHREYNIKSLGESEFKKLEARYMEITEIPEGKREEEVIKEYDSIYQLLYSNTFYKNAASLFTKKNQIDQFAFMIVMCIEPANFDFEGKGIEWMAALNGLLQKKLDFFRNQTKKA